MKVVLTGAGGFVGRACIQALLDAGFEVHQFGRSWTEGAGKNAGTHVVDLFDYERVTALIAAIRPSHLLHLAWVTEPGKYWSSPENLLWVSASLHLILEFARRGGRRVVIAGSCAEYDWRSGGVFNECQSPITPATLYGTSKDALRRIVGHYCSQSGISFAWARLFFMYGPGEHPSKLVASMIRAGLAAQSVPCSAGLQQRDFMYVSDVGCALAALLLAEVQGPVNIGTGRAVAVREVVRVVEELLGRPGIAQIGALPTAPDEPPLVVADPRRLEGEVGYRPRVDLRAGLEQSIAFWKHHGRCQLPEAP
jgi:nucleoside-diphosphate-sugar epimerase